MAWIKFEIGTSEKPEVWQMADSLKMDPDAVVGKLLRVWSWFDEHTTDGNAPSVTKSLLDSKLRVSGFCDSMISCGWMLESEGKIYLPNFDRHNGHTAKNRALSAKRAASHKENKSKVTQNFDYGNAKVTLNALPREEKRREEKIREESNTNSCPEPAASRPHEVEVDERYFFRVKGQKEPWYCPTELVAAFERTYDTIDIHFQLRAAMLWVETKPSRAKTARGMPAFLSSWIMRAIDNPKTPRKQQPRQPIDPNDPDFHIKSFFQ